jgi:hypothetical protein
MRASTPSESLSAADARALVAEQGLDDVVRAIVADAPSLAPEQLATLRTLFAGGAQ